MTPVPEAAYVWREFSSGEELAHALAGKVAAQLREAISARGNASLAVSGGTTPAKFFQALSNEKLDWSRVTVTLVDERFVEPSSPRSNQKLVEENLLRGPATAARFVPLYRSEPDAPDAIRKAAADLEKLPWPLDVVVLGMGTDGHTASFFPDAANLPDLLDPQSPDILKMVSAPSAGETRITLALPPIVSARSIVLHIEGASKREVLEVALAGRSAPPVRAVFDHAGTPVEIFWAP